LPSTSPPWMFAMTSTAGLPVARSSPGVRTRSFDSTTSGIARPSVEVVSVVIATRSEPAATCSTKLMTSA